MVIISNRRLKQDLMTGKPSDDNITEKVETRPYDR